MKILFALLKREILEHKNIWRVPLILIAIAALVKFSLMFGNLSIDIDVPDQFQLDDNIDQVLDGVVGKALNVMNSVIVFVMFLVAVFYALSCLYAERQDQSVLFWRSLPISDGLTITSKLVIALVVIPLMILLCQALVATVILGADGFDYLAGYYGSSTMQLGKLIFWSLMPTVAWCVLCSEIASKNPFLLAFVAPIVLILVDKLFLNGVISQTFVINRLTGVSEYSLMPFVWGALFTAICIVTTIVKRSQRI